MLLVGFVVFVSALILHGSNSNLGRNTSEKLIMGRLVIIIVLLLVVVVVVIVVVLLVLVGFSLLCVLLLILLLVVVLSVCWFLVACAV